MKTIAGTFFKYYDFICRYNWHCCLFFTCVLDWFVLVHPKQQRKVITKYEVRHKLGETNDVNVMCYLDCRHQDPSK